jgi:hypothetical protein
MYVWLGDKAFSEVYPGLFRIVRQKDDKVAHVLRTTNTPLNVSFRRGLVNRITWFDLVSKIVLVHLTNERDVFR